MRHGFRRIFKTHRRAFKSHSRRAKKARYIRGKKRFQRRLNQVAEKKIYQVQTVVNDLIRCDAANVVGGLMGISFPPIGTGPAQRIGSKIFIRYFTVDMYVYNEGNAHSCENMLGLLNLKFKTANVTAYTIAQIFGISATPSGMDYQLLKQGLSKMRLKTYKMGNGYEAGAAAPVSTTYPNVRHFKQRFKIMKNAELTANNTLSIPDVFMFPLYFAPPYTTVGANPGRWQATYSMSYTDV